MSKYHSIISKVDTFSKKQQRLIHTPQLSLLHYVRNDYLSKQSNVFHAVKYDDFMFWNFILIRRSVYIIIYLTDSLIVSNALRNQSSKVKSNNSDELFLSRLPGYTLLGNQNI